MATVPGLKKIGPFWHYSIQVNGQRAHGSTKATDHATAKRVMEEKRRELLHDQLNLKKRIPPTMNQVWDSWWKGNQKAYSRGYLQSAECRYRRWIKPKLGLVRIDRLNSECVLELRAHQLRAGCSPRYANNTLELVRTLTRSAIKNGHLTDLPFSVKFLRVQRRPRVIVPSVRLSDFLVAVDEEAKTLHPRIILRVMVGLGVREGEALGMRWEWFDPSFQTYTVGKAKGREARVLPVPDWLWGVIHGMSNPTHSGWVFPAEDGNPHRSQYCTKVLKRVCKRLGLGNVTQHRLRATFASLHAEAGTPITEIQGMLGHKNIQTTMIYVETSLDAKRRAQDTLSQILGLAKPSVIVRRKVLPLVKVQPRLRHG